MMLSQTHNMEFVISTCNFLFCLIHSCAKLNWNVCVSKHNFLELQILVAINLQHVEGTAQPCTTWSSCCPCHFFFSTSAAVPLRERSSFQILVKTLRHVFKGLDGVPCTSLVNVSRYVSSHKLNNLIIWIKNTNYTLQGVARFNGVKKSSYIVTKQIVPQCIDFYKLQNNYIAVMSFSFAVDLHSNSVMNVSKRTLHVLKVHFI